jgi:hypothetical protein
MLKVDLAHSSDEALAGAVAALCARLGTVARVTVYAARAGAPARPFAIVAMTTREGAEKVSATFGGRTVGSAAVLFLEQLADPGFAPIDAETAKVKHNVVTLGDTDRPRT